MTSVYPKIDLVDIDARARQLRADMLASAGRNFVAWLRKPRRIGATVSGRTA